MGKNSKRPKSFYINNAKRKKLSNELTTNMSGFLCTCNSKEKQCVREAYNILNEFADILYGKNHQIDSKSIDLKGKEMTEDKTNDSGSTLIEKMEEKSDSDSDDIESSLKKEVEALKKANQTDGTKKSRFQQVFLRANNCIFISTTLPNPVELSLAIMDNILETQKARTQYLLRMVPVQNTCRAYLDDIKKTAEELIHEHFPKQKIKYYISCKVRNNDSIKKEDVAIDISSMINSYNLEAVADYKYPDIVLNIDIIKNICCLGLLPDFLTKYCKYNLLKLVEPKIKVENVNTVSNNSSDKCGKVSSESNHVPKEVTESRVHESAETIGENFAKESEETCSEVNNSLKSELGSEEKLAKAPNKVDTGSTQIESDKESNENSSKAILNSESTEPQSEKIVEK